MSGPLRALVLAMCLSALVMAQQAPSPAPLGLDEYVPVPHDNPLTPAKVRLGERLFFDRAFSSDSRVSCASCHDPARAFTSGGRVGTGVFGRRGVRNVPTIINRGYGRSFFWDGRAATLEEQALGPLLNQREMGLSLPAFIARLQTASYRSAFAEVFAEPPTPEAAARALASYVRAQRAGNAPYDRYRAGDSNALSPAARRGLRLFRGRANCAACHVGPNFTDEDFHNTGISWGSRDVGRQSVSGRAEDRGRFKTPTLRQLRLTGPYMHDGSLETLETVVAFYDAGGKPNPFLDPEVRPLRLTAAEKSDLVAFLLSLSS